MSKFFFIIWLKWSFNLTLYTLISASLLSAIATGFLYIRQGMQDLNGEVSLALFNIFKFWFVLFWSVMLLVYLFRGLKYIFNNCHNGYKLTLLSCLKEEKSETIEHIGYGDLIKVWRKWFLLIIWLVASLMIISLVLTKLFAHYNSVFEWFNIYILYIFILLSAYASFIILSSRCKRVKLVKC